MLISALRPDPQAKAVELEHETFRNAKVANLYKASVLKKVGPRLVGKGRVPPSSREERADLPPPLGIPEPLPEATSEEQAHLPSLAR